MTVFSRRRFLQATGAAAAAPIVGPLLGAQPSFAQAGKVLTIAYNVALPSWDPTTGPSAVNPTIQSIYKAVFDSYIDQEPDLSFKPGLLTKWGWNKDKTKVADDRAQGRVLARRHAGHAGGRGVVAGARGRSQDAAIRSSSSGARSATSRSTADVITADVKEFEPTLFKWMAFLTGYVLPKKAYTASRRRKGSRPSRSAAGPYMVEKFERNAYIRLKAFPKYWGPKPAFETVVFKLVPDATSRVGGSRERRFRSHAGSAVRGIRPAHQEAQPDRRRASGVGHRDDLHHQPRADARQERAPGDDLRGRQEGDRRQAAARLRRRHRHAGGAAVRGLRSVHQGQIRSGAGQAAAGQVRLSAPTSRSSSPSRPRADSSRRTTR